MLKLWHKLQDFADIKGGAILGVFSVAIVVLCVYAVFKGRPFPSEVRDIYLGVIAAFAATNITKYYKQGD